MITRNNYEEFFLLYVDNELSATERDAVERFVRDNPDLTTELDQLKQSVLHPGDDLHFANKESLLRELMPPGKISEENLLRGELPVWAGESAFFDEENYPTYLLSYIDNELDEESRKIVADHVRQHPRLEEELAILQQTRLQADTSVVFDGKELLYKVQYSKRGLILSWSRMAAAILLLIAGLLLFSKTRQRSGIETGTHGIAGETRGDKNEKNEKIFRKDSQSVTPGVPVPLYSKKETPVSSKSADSSKREENAVSRNGGTERITTHSRVAGQFVAAGTHGKGSPDKRKDPATGILPSDRNIAGNHPVDNNPDVVKDVTTDIATPDPPPVKITNPPPVSGEAVASGNNAVVPGNRDNTIVMAREGIPIEDPSATRKNKMRGLFRKVTRVLGRTTNAENDNNDNNKRGVLIGSFQVAL